MQSAFDKQRPPGGQGCTGQRRRFLEAQVVGNGNEPDLGAHDHFRKHAVDAAAPAGARNGFRGSSSAREIFEERACDPIPDVELCDVGTNCNDFAGAI